MGPQAYLDRIRYAGPLAPSAGTLRALHRHHMLSVPFENLDIGLGREIVLDPGRFVEKIVRGHRGGFCYELNGAFAALLRAAGFGVTLLSARVADKSGNTSPEFDHLTLRVDVGQARLREARPEQGRAEDSVPRESWLADVGFGDNFLEPLRFVSHAEQHDRAGTFRLMDAGERWRLERRDPEGRWRLQYDFSLRPRELREFAGMCRYHQTSPDSHFTRNRICSLATPDGRVTLSGLRLIVTSNGRKRQRALKTEADWHSALRRHFGIVLESEAERLDRHHDHQGRAVVGLDLLESGPLRVSRQFGRSRKRGDVGGPLEGSE
jgi:N-hydroxyarylamine O-acetyltransferase